MDNLWNEIWLIIQTYGLAGIVMGVEGWVIYKLYARNTELVKDITALHDRIHEEANKESQEKTEYLNQHIITMTKATEAIAGVAQLTNETKKSMDDLRVQVQLSLQSRN